MSTVVHRIENAEGWGPYRASGTYGEDMLSVWRNHSGSSNHPNSWRDGLETWDNGDWRFGFLTIEQLMKWFNPEEMAILYNNGFQIRTYTTSEYHVGGSGKQIVFLKEQEQ